VDAVVPQNASTSETPSSASHSDAPAIGRITSGQDLLAQARTLTEYCASSRTAGCQRTI
jgi:type VI secretion system protein VasJ